MALRAMCMYFDILTPSPSRESPTVLANSFPVEFGSCLITGIPHLDVVVSVQGQCGLHFSRTPFSIVRGWGNSGTNCCRWLVCWCECQQIVIELFWCFQPPLSAQQPDSLCSSWIRDTCPRSGCQHRLTPHSRVSNSSLYKQSET